MDDYMKRVVDEKAALDEKREKLAAFLAKDDTLTVVDAFEFTLLSQQIQWMNAYSDTLGARIGHYTAKQAAAEAAAKVEEAE